MMESGGDEATLVATPESTTTLTRIRVCLTSDQPMVAESVRTALSANGIDAVVLEWHDSIAAGDLTSRVDSSAGQAGDVRSPRSHLPRHGPDVALFLSTLDAPEQESAVQTLSTEVPVPWIVLSHRPRGTQWGAALEGGACAVIPDSTNLDEMMTVLHRVVRGEDVMDETHRGELVTSWRLERWHSARRDTLLGSLSPREREVLEALAEGNSVRSITTASGVSEATVRTQVQRIRRKLGVSSQLAAVALLREVLEHSTAATPGLS